MTSLENDLSQLLNDLQISNRENPEPLEDYNIKTKWVKPQPTQQDLNNELKSRFLNPSNTLTWDLLDLIQDVPEKDTNQIYDSLIRLPPSINRLSFRSKRKGINGEIIDFKEQLNNQELINSNSSNSISLNRTIGNTKPLEGDTSQLPFKPGGLNLTAKNQNNDSAKLLHRDENGLFDLPNGLSRGLKQFNQTNKHSTDIEELEKDVDHDEEYDNRYEITQESNNLESNDNVISLGEIKDNESQKDQEKHQELMDIDELLPVDLSFSRNLVSSKNSINNQVLQKKQWAHVVDLNHKIENFNELIPNMARTWPFELDTFQQEAVYHLEQGDSVFVAAHTSAGKTVIAEYAIAMANRNMTKAIYTSPIKALSNQKFRDFKQTFTDVDTGLITGDVQINPDANCLIMTTEILRSMLYRGADIIRDVEFVIFDEVHYVNDIERGVVWEEVIIMLPDHVKFILLSATVPNTFEFANWVGRTKQKDIYVISTPKRPVPLEISIWGKGKLTKVIDAERKFLQGNFNTYRDAYEGKKPDGTSTAGARGGRGGRGGAQIGRGGSNSGRGNSRGGRGGAQNGRGGSSNGLAPQNRFQISRPNKNTWIELVQFLNSNSLLPAVIFVFSKKRCEEYANTLQSIDFCNAKEKSQIHMFIDKAVSRLKKEDRELPQILAVRDFLSRGIAVHHGGLLPIVKEVIEILFAKTLVKVLFATETFAMGLNLPTRTVVFSELRKHDGTSFRNLLPGEFTQMSGRAGRRGLDKTGTVIVMSYSEPLVAATFKEVTLGTPTKLVSQFRLTYNMILNLLRIEALRVEEMIKHSFSENSSQTLLPEHEKKIKQLEETLNGLPELEVEQGIDKNDLNVVFDHIIRYKELTKEIILENNESVVLSKNFNIGRIVVFRDLKDITRIGFTIRNNRSDKTITILGFDIGKAEKKVPSGLPFLSQLNGFIKNNFTKMTYDGSFNVYHVPLTDIELISRLRTNVSIFNVLRNNEEEITALKRQIDLFLSFQYKLKEIDFTQFATLKLHELLDERENILQELSKNYSNIYLSKNFEGYFKALYERFEINGKINNLKSLMSDENLELLPDYEQRLEILKSLGFVDDKLNVVLKGRVACEINCGWELAITELVLDNFLGDFEPEEIVALLSAFVYEGRSSKEEEEPKISPRLERGKSKIFEIMGNLLDVFNRYQVTLTSDEHDFLERNRFALVNVVYEWARGMTFKEIMDLSIEAEGTIVRVITRLDEICREVKSAALIIGDSSLHAKMSIAQEMIKRDIVFCASLYL
ncbi:hypothetical protein WICMUC_005002 [Wickerhamomyces mucosus]|uniref:Antiviral helicase SKI2 n=1 Tax=Wickerhamomyces mucosus TaxID=1378264 RepID=A0A9P8PBH2_9ASCO|nr:hypothetical protein WICMUC_005002 [Wickerhamomyces mucosus]